jgi:CheY-like chemotaxis protein
MSAPLDIKHYRLLVVDDNRAIHDDFKKILAPDMELKQLDAIEADLFGRTIEISAREDFEIDSAYQGEEGLNLVKQALHEGQPYALAFIDMRMPPGWNGIETIEHIWKADPELQIVICSAYSDHSWAEIAQRLGNNDRLLILKKPFDNVEILQMAYAMSNKCELARQQKTWQQRNTTSANDIATNVHELNSLRNTIDDKLLMPIEDIKDSVSLLQHSFEDLNEQIKHFRTALLEMAKLPPEQAIRELLSSTNLPDFGDTIPDAFQRLHSALKKVSPETLKAEESDRDKPMH